MIHRKIDPAEHARLQAIREANRRDFEHEKYFHRSLGNVQFEKEKNILLNSKTSVDKTFTRS